MDNNSNPIIGYSAFILFDECYEYNENACYVADSPESLKAFLKDATFNINDYRFDKIKLSDILDDFGGSSGEFAMEPEALKRFKQVSSVTYAAEPYDDPFNDGEPDLFIVNIDKKKNEAVEESKSIPSSTGFENDYYPGYSGQPSRKSKKNKRKQAKASKKENRR